MLDAGHGRYPRDVGLWELLSEAILTAEQAKKLAELDAGVMAHVESLAPGSKGWDVEMLKDTAKLIRTNKSGIVQ